MSRVPKLRFKEFSGEWKEKEYEDISEKIQDGTHFSPAISDNGEYLYITSKNVKNGYLDFSNIAYVTSEEHKSIYKRCDVKYGDVLLTKDGTIGQACVNTLNEEFSLLSSVAFIRLNNEHSNYFLYQLIVSPYGQAEINKAIAGQALKRITLTKIKNFKGLFPQKSEQQKIASFLSAVDSKIDQLSRKKELLERYKKGIMQKIFSQELRFKADDGSAFPEWEEKKLGEIGKFSAGGDLNKLDYTKDKDELHRYPIYANGAGEGLYGYATTFQYKENSVTVSGRGNLGYANVRKQDFNAIVRLIVIEPKAYINSKYLEETINSINFAIESTGVPQLTVPQISSYMISIPCFEEQTRIANFLSALDTKIDFVAKQLDVAKNFKKGLLQQMFV